MGKETIQALVDGGHASAGPPLGPKLGPLGVNVPKLIADINNATKEFENIKVPVEIIVNTETKTWDITVGSPPTSQLLFKEMKIAKGSGAAWFEGVATVTPAKTAAPAAPAAGGAAPAPAPAAQAAPAEKKEPVVGDVPKKVIIKVAKLKKNDMGTKTLKAAVKNVIGTCVSAGLKVEGKKPKDVLKEIDSGAWDHELKE
jgi:large subunit ribosomal protein L11